MKRKRLWTAIALTAACTAAVLLLVLPVRSTRLDAIEARYAAGELSGAMAAVAAQQDTFADHQQRAAALFLVANAYRQLGLNREFQEAIKQLKSVPGSDELANLAVAMFKIQHGELNDSPAALVDVLRGAGALDADARSVAIQGAFAAGRYREAEQLLDAWRAQQAGAARPTAPQLEYLTAVSFNIAGATEQAESKLIAAIETHPRHELSWLALAELYSRPPNVRFRKTEYVLQQLARRFPHNPDAQVRLARVRRRLGEAERSRGALAAADTESELLEKANIEFDLGNYQQTVATLEAVQLATAADFRRLTDTAFELSLRGQGDAGGALSERVSWGATALALSGASATARTAFDDAADRTARLRRLQDLSNQQAAEPQQRGLARESDRLVSLATPFVGKPLERFEPAAATARSTANARGLELYQLHCAHCHGRNGRGDGRGACNLFPAPRNFREEPIRLISSKNRIPSDGDLTRTIRRGEPGTSMPAFERLSDDEVAQLVEVVRQFIFEGLQDAYAREVTAGRLEHDAAAEQEWLAARSQASEAAAIPELHSTPELVVRGGEWFRTTGCVNCHAAAHEPAQTVTRFFDALGRPMHAPDLEADPFHGGDDPAEIYKRIILGIPGTPHPALATDDASTIECLVAYIRSLRSTQPAVLSNYMRSRRPDAPASALKRQRVIEGTAKE